MTRFELAVLLALTAVPLQAKPRALRPGAEELLLKTLAGPATGYAAVERVQVFRAGQKPKALKINVTGLPGGRRRLEVLGKKKAIALVQVSGASQGEAPAIGLARLRSIYELAVSTGGVVAKRKTWKIELHLKKTGALRRALWVDRDSGLLMKRETYRADGSLARRERVVKLELSAAVDPALFAAVPVAGPWTPDGFVFVGESGGARHYSNGLESYDLARVGGKFTVSGDLAEDDAARVLESAVK